MANGQGHSLQGIPGAQSWACAVVAAESIGGGAGLGIDVVIRRLELFPLKSRWAEEEVSVGAAVSNTSTTSTNFD